MGDLSIFQCLLQFLSSIFKVISSCKSFTCLVRITVRCLISFEVIVKGVVPLISFLVHSSSAYRRATDLSGFILYPAVFLKVFISARSPRGNFGDSLHVLAYHLQIKIFDFFLISISMSSFSCLITLGNTSNTILNKYGESGQLRS